MASALASLERARTSYGAGWAETKLALIGRAWRSSLRSARAVRRLHEVLCFLRAYPDDARVLAEVERRLEAFDLRPDLRRNRASLADSGICGTPIHYRFFWSSARWLAHRWPGSLFLDRSDAQAQDRLAVALPLLVTPVEAMWLKASGVRAYAALDRLRAVGETDAVFLVRRVASMPGDSATRESFFDAIDASLVLKPGAATPSRTKAWIASAPAAFREKGLRRARPGLRREIARAPQRIRRLALREAGEFLDLARGATVTRARDLDAFAYGDRRDVRLVEDDDGLGFAVNGVVPQRRAPVAATYGYLTLQNGVPIGYGQLDFVGRTVAISFNTFETFRGAEAAWNFARLLAMAHHVFGAESFSVDPYQLGRDNEEALASGAWWFYYKLGFRPRDARARRLAGREAARARRISGYRSGKAVLRRLADSPVFFELVPARARGLPPLAELGARAAADLAAHAGADRKRALRECALEAMRLCGLRSLRGFSRDERQAWERWAPLVAVLPGVSRWSAEDKRALAGVIRAKGARCEGDFVARFAAHAKLERALFGRY